jgi:hypothetical protein
MTYSDFIARFPEFTNTDTALVNSVLAEAGNQVSATVWGTRQNEGIGLLTAHFLTMSPRGQPARMAPGMPSQTGTRSTVYRDEFNMKLRQVTMGFRNA